MRQIKFRYKVITGSGHVLTETFPLGDIENGRVLSWLKNNNVSDDNSVIHVDQFTGLQDKNGVDIYEGDICNVREHGKVIYSVVEVLFSSTYASFGYRGYYCGKGTGDYYGIRVSGVNSVEVVGNVHESPELLEAT